MNHYVVLAICCLWAVIATATGQVVYFDAPSYTVSEGDPLTLTVQLNETLHGDFSVTIGITGGSATAADDDYSLPDGESLMLTFPPNVTEQSVTILAVLDILVEGQEQFTLSLTELMDGSGDTVMLGPDMSMATLVILDQTVELVFSQAEYTVDEGSSVNVELRRTASNVNRPVSVNVSSGGGTSMSGIDYIDVSETLTFSPSQSTHTVNVTTLTDLVVEGDETFTLSVTSSDTGVILPSATVRITDRTVRIGFVQTVYMVEEGDTISVTVQVMEGTLNESVEVTVQAVDGTAGGDDTTIVPVTLTFSSEQTTGTVNITAAADNEVEGEEDVVISLTTTSSNVLLEPSNASIIILDTTILVQTPPTDRSVAVNNTLNMTCSFQSANGLTISWFRDGMAISNTSPFSISVMSNNFNYSSELSIDPATFDLCGDYHCTASAGEESVSSASANLQVVELINSSDPAMTLSVGAVANLFCTVRSCGRPVSIQWAIPEDDETMVSFAPVSTTEGSGNTSDTTSVVTINTVGLINRGNAQSCYVRDPPPGEGDFALEQIFTFTMENVAFIESPPSSLRVMSGDTVQLNCSAENPPGVNRPLLFSWHYGGLEGADSVITNTPRYDVTTTENRSVLIIRGITNSESGTYFCAVTNRLEFEDAINSSTEITVQYAPIVNFPKDVILPEGRLEIPAGEDHDLICSITAEPSLSLITISRDGIEVARTNSITELTYTITNPMLNDTGTVYSCRAENVIDSNTVNLTLEVEAPPAAVDITTLSSSLISLLAARLTWTPPADNNAEITNYTISVCVDTSGCSSNDSFVEYPSDRATVDVEVLPNRTHVVRITATNRVGSSDDSDDGVINGAMEGDADVELDVDLITDNLALLSWTLPVLATTPTATNPSSPLQPVAVNNYTLTYRVGSSENTVTLTDPSDSALLTSLTADSMYTFMLTVDYAEGLIDQIAEGAMEQRMTVEAYMPPDPPNPPKGTPDGIKISWEPVNAGDSLSRYEVFVRVDTSGNRKKRQTPMTFNVSRTNTSYLFEDDEPFTRYMVSVDGVLEVGEEVGRVQALADTPVTSAEQQPSQPQDLQAVDEVTGFTTFTVDWMPPNEPNGIIQDYTVRYTGEVNGELTVGAPNNGQGRIMATIRNVKGSGTYRVTVTARNGQPEESDPSTQIEVTTETGVFPPTISQVTADDNTERYSVLIGSFSDLYGPLSHFFVFVITSPDIATAREENIAAAYPVGSGPRLVTIGDGSNTTYGGRTYRNRPVERGTQYYFFIRLFSSEMAGLFNDSEPVRGDPLSEEDDEGPSVIAIVGGVLGAVAAVLVIVLIILLVYAFCGSKVRVYKVPRLRRLDDGEGKGGLELRRRTRLFSPVLDVGDPNVFTSADQPTTLICEVSGTPAPTVTWTRGGKPLEDERILVLADHSLFIQDTCLEDQGDYLVTAENSAGTSEALIKVTVLKPTPPEPDIKDHPPVPVDNFPEYHARLSANDAEDLEDEYSEIEPDFVNTSYTAKLPINRNKNRYINIIPYDHSRVVLQLQENTPGSDYVNASYMDGYKRSNNYIATQGPTTSTFSDFWRMVWELDSPTIVMVTKLKEEDKVKCNQYWPSYGSTTYGNVQVTLKEAENLAEYSIRTFSVSPLAGQSNAQMPVREVKQFHFLKWPDHGVPHYATAILHFRKRVHVYHPEKRGPMVVHCSAGVGRTGTFITIDYMMEQMEAEGTVDIYNYVQQMRYKRNYMVQTSPQYVFIHEAINEAITCGDTSIKAPELKVWLTKQEPDPATGKTTLEAQFERLSSASPKDEDFDCSVAELNKDKNRTNEHLPSNENRVVLSTENDQSDYICASTVDGYRQRNAFMITQGPMKNTVGDFWRMVWEYKSAAIVMLTQLEEEEEEMSVKYWPDEVGQPEVFGLFHVELSSEVRDLGEYSTRKLKLSPVDKAHESRIVTQFHYTKWARTATPTTAKAMIDMIDELQRVQRKSGNQPITVHCNDGLGRTGTFCTLYYVLDRVKTEQVVDVFQAVKTLRIQRTGLLENKDQYEFVHRATMEFLDTFSDYQNFK